MKPIYVILSLIFVLPVFSQETIDHAKFRASYTFAYKTRPEQADYAKTDLTYLDIGNKLSKYYSRYTQIRDSNKIAGLKKGLSVYEVVDNIHQLKEGIKTVVYSFVESGKFHVVERLVDYYCYDEKRVLPKWTMGMGRKTIAGYECKEAEATYLGRKWIVYFAPDIPIHLGPWKLWGLPGLIVHATDSEHFFQFELKGFETLTNEIPIIQKNETAFGKAPYKKITKKEYLKIERLCYRDFMEYTKIFVLEGGGHISMTPEQKEANERHKRKGGTPYIPLEK